MAHCWYLQKKTENIPLKQWIEEMSPSRNIYASIEPIKVNNWEGFRAIRDQLIKPVDTEGAYWEDAYFEHSGKIYRLMGVAGKGTKESWLKNYQTLFEKIVEIFTLSL